MIKQTVFEPFQGIISEIFGGAFQNPSLVDRDNQVRLKEYSLNLNIKKTWQTRDKHVTNTRQIIDRPTSTSSSLSICTLAVLTSTTTPGSVGGGEAVGV